jgi:hypothetical protein
MRLIALLTLPDGDGSSGQVLQTECSGALSWTSVGAASISAGGLSADKITVGAGKIIVSNGSSQVVAVTMSGDVKIDKSATTTIVNGAVTSDKLSKDLLITSTETTTVSDKQIFTGSSHIQYNATPAFWCTY